MYDFFKFPIINWWSDPVEAVAANGALPAVEAQPSVLIFQLTVLNIILFVGIYLISKLFIKYIKRYFKALHLTEKQLTIEGKEIAVWKLSKQLIYLVAFYFSFLSLKFTNPNMNFTNLLNYRFFSIQQFHISVYHLFLTPVIIFIARFTLNFLKVFLLKAVRQSERIDSGTEYIYLQLAKYLVYSIAIIISLRSFGMDLDLFLTATTFLLVGVGLGLQSIFSDYFSGILLLLEGTIKVGDVIEIETLNTTDNFVAKVIQINLRTSKVETRDEKVLVIPNSKLTQESVINWSFGTPVNRFSIPLTVHYGVDTELVKTILIECAERHEEVLKRHKPFVRLLKFGDYGLEMDLMFWAEQNLYIEMLKSEIRFDIDREFRLHGITIPYPQSEIYLKSQPGLAKHTSSPTESDNEVEKDPS